MVRKHYFVSGSVQGVGFRYRAYYAANALGLTGFVRNMDDGRVEIELQGDKSLMSRFFDQVEMGHFIYIEDMEESTIPLDKNEASFEVRD